MRVLMVENHAIFARTVITQFLGDHDVDLVPTIGAARASIVGTPYEAVLVDYDLDDGKGDAFVRSLVEVGFSGPIIAISSHEEGNSALVQAGATAVCKKTKFHNIAAVLQRRAPT